MSSEKSSVETSLNSDIVVGLHRLGNEDKQQNDDGFLLGNCNSSATHMQVCNNNFMGANDSQNNGNAKTEAYYIAACRKQQIILDGNDSNNSFNVCSKDVDIVTSRVGNNKEKSSGSNKFTEGSESEEESDHVKATPVVKFDWEQRKYIGNLVAVHRNNNFVAYCLRGKAGANIRIINRKTADRVLLKDFHGRVVDLAFAHCDEIILAAVDTLGNLYIYQISNANENKIISQMLQINRKASSVLSDFHRVIWCPYIPEDYDDDSTLTEDACRILVVTHDEVAEILNVAVLISKYGQGPLEVSNIDHGLMRVSSHTKPLVDAAISPDGSAVATASLDGYVKFFQVYVQEDTTPRCLHKWKPHGGQPLSSLFFLDDYKNPRTEIPFWKFAISGANNNQELKIWSCESWTCLQTIRFMSPPCSDTEIELCMKAMVDMSAHYLILTDFRRKILDVLQISQDHTVGTAQVISVAEFLLTQPCLSFAILDASAKKFCKSMENAYTDEVTTGELERDDDDKDKTVGGTDEIVNGIQIKLYSVHTTILQELHIRYPDSSVPSSASFSSSQDDFGLKDGLSDITSLVDSSVSDSFNRSEIQPVLLTPDAFISGRSNTSSNNSSFTQVTAIEETTETVLLASSSVMQTSNSNKDISSQKTLEVTPSSLSLSLVTSVEEEELTTSCSTMKDLTLQETQQTKQISVEKLFKIQPNCETENLNAVDLDIRVYPKVRRKSIPPLFDETDNEVAEVMGEDNTPVMKQEVEVAQVTNDIKEEMPEKRVSPREWPKPPNVGSEALRIAAATDSVISRDEEDDGDDVRIEEVVEEVTNEINLSESNDVEIKMQEKPATKESPKDEITLRDKAVQVVERESINELHEKLHQIMSILQTQQQNLKELNERMIQQEEQQSKAGSRINQILHQFKLQQPNIEQRFRGMENVLSSRLERILEQHVQKESQLFQQKLNETQALEKKEETLTKSWWQTLDDTLQKNVEATVKTEIKNNIVPVLIKTIEPIKNDLHKEVAQKLTATDALLKESLSKVIRNQQTIDAIGSSVGSVIEVPIQAAYKEAFHNVVIPAFERITQKLFQQVNEAFQRGTNEYAIKLQSHLEVATQQQQELRDPIIAQMKALLSEFKSNADDLQVNLFTFFQNRLDKMLKQSLTSLKDTLVQHVHDVVKVEVNQALKEQGIAISDNVLSAMRSGGVTPVSAIPDPQAMQTKILEMLKKDQFNAAFKEALSASNLDLVMLICEKADPTKIFAQDAFFHQPVLLSLIQQLSADIQTQTKLKVRYLEEAILSLDPDNPVTQEHIRSVLMGLYHRLKAYLENEPNMPEKRPLRRLLMITESHLP